MHRAAAIVVAALVSLHASGAGAAPIIPLEVQSVVSGGFWREGNRAGTYRVVIERQGWEHIWSRLYVEWIAEPSDRDAAEAVVAVIEPSLPFGEGTTILEAKVKRRGVGRLEIVIDGIPNGAGLADKRRSVTLEATGPGQVRTLKE